MAVGCQQPAVVRDPWERQPGRMVDCARRDRRTPDDSHIMTSEWTPLLDGTLADRAMEAVDAIALDPAMRPPLDQDAGDGADPSLAGGAAGRALFYAYLSEGREDQADIAADTALELIAGAFAAISGSGMPASLYEGFAGIGWVYAHLAGRLFDAEGDWPLAPIDEAIAAHLTSTPWLDDYDLISGLVGFGVYALEQPERPSRTQILDLVVHRLAETAERNAGRATWFTPPARLVALQLMQAPAGFYNLGMAHGVPGVLALLGRVHADGASVADGLLDAAVSWTMAQELPSGRESAFPYWQAPDGEPSPARLAWCYGDPGVAVALFAAGRAASRADWEADAMRIALRAASRSLESSGIEDAGLCHGAAGLGHIFNRLFQATGDERFAEAARRWLAQALAYRKPGEGIGGFLALGGNGRREPDADTGFLTGAAGVGLALLAACTSIEPAWDRALLVDVG